MSPSITVHGGPASIAADAEDMVSTSRVLAIIADALLSDALTMQTELLDLDLLVSAPLDVLGAARFEASMARALDGPHGLAAVALDCEATRLSLAAAAELYLSVDRIETELTPELQFFEGYPHLIDPTTVGELLTGHLSAAGQRELTDDPALVDLVVRGLATPSGAGVTGMLTGLARTLPDGEPVVTSTGIDCAAAGIGPPRSLRDLLSNLARRNDAQPGAIDVQILTTTSASGQTTRHVVVDIPGTKTFDLRGGGSDVADVESNYRAMAGEQTTYEKGVLLAMRDAGVLATDQVTLVGHSLGGTVAVNTARDALASGQFDVTNVITAGAPIGTVVQALPATVKVLALENSGDVVPHLDGYANPDKGNVTTVTIDDNMHDVDKNHGLDTSYVPAAAAVDASGDPSIGAYLASLSGTLSATTVTTHTYVVTRR